jgi:hypothetical protein
MYSWGENMKLKTLKKLLSELPAEFDEKNVVLSADAEGNGFSALADVGTCCMKKEKNSCFFDMVWNEDGETQPKANTVVLWPV